MSDTPEVTAPEVTAKSLAHRVAAWRMPLPADPGIAACLLIGVLMVAFAISVDFPKAAYGFQSCLLYTSDAADE